MSVVVSFSPNCPNCEKFSFGSGWCSDGDVMVSCCTLPSLCCLLYNYFLSFLNYSSYQQQGAIVVVDSLHKDNPVVLRLSVLFCFISMFCQIS